MSSLDDFDLYKPFLKSIFWKCIKGALQTSVDCDLAPICGDFRQSEKLSEIMPPLKYEAFVFLPTKVRGRQEVFCSLLPQMPLFSVKSSLAIKRGQFSRFYHKLLDGIWKWRLTKLGGTLISNQNIFKNLFPVVW